eukprot:CAMPEP_0118681296 /NCGR_PEP_ID=MMETSP0800-20121206/4858_1 /TAXON_ID=210618 ORGANISM="Striatella unipunctata, Strain CCMP2910" /NCGR_SAMPLE_ID=MMETSP0800 /ASSEMBLY_ACC=CAM_ASM_000638 /LENGTH=36 /DNA_ID= /DNA_START= /DNA_END= /DNA_ORIENTATION=
MAWRGPITTGEHVYLTRGVKAKGRRNANAELTTFTN